MGENFLEILTAIWYLFISIAFAFIVYFQWCEWNAYKKTMRKLLENQHRFLEKWKNESSR